ncbi:hypothetical protein PG991_013539 [Apiospora marii]|uniref:HNH nuclease domain-containing protein n=2 Tax=Apiospora marii TaxID=335849 RepID=A0ABR1R6A7_9PEZI
MTAIQWDRESRAALEAGRTVRCLTRQKYRQECRRPTHVKAWAEKRAEKACKGLVQGLDGDPAPVLTKQLLVIYLRRKHVYLCFDVFLPPAAAPKDQEVDENPGDTSATTQLQSEDCQHDHFKTDQPIYYLYRETEGFRLRRNKNFDKICAAHYSQIQVFDKGGLPYFMDTLKPAVYIDGILQEDDDLEEGGEEGTEDLDSEDKDADEKSTAADTSPDSADSI